VPVTLPLPNLDNRTWADLKDEGVSLIPRHAPEWTDHNVHDPGITLIELLAYRTEQELYRLNTVGAAHRQAFLSLIDPKFLPTGARPAVALLAYVPPASPQEVPPIAAGEFLAPWPPARDRTPDGSDPPPPSGAPVPHPPVYRAAHDLDVTGIRVAAVQSFDGHRFRDVTRVVTRFEPATPWGDDPIDPEGRPADQQPALHLGLDRPLWQIPAPQVAAPQRERHSLLTLWFVPDETGLVFPPDPEPPPEARSAAPPAAGFRPYDPAAAVPPHHGLEVVWEVLDGCAWKVVSTCPGFRDETRGFTRPGRVVIPAPAIPVVNDGEDQDRPARAERAVGVAPSRHFYLRCRLARGRPDAPPRLRAVLADAVLVEQWEQPVTALAGADDGCDRPLVIGDLVLPRGTAKETATDLEGFQGTAEDVREASDDLARRGWGHWGAPVGDPESWPVSDSVSAADRVNDPPEAAEDRERARVGFVVLGIGSGEPGQQFKLRCPSRWPKPDPFDPGPPAEPPPPAVIADSIDVWTMEPPWGWDPRAAPPGAWARRQWLRVADLSHCSRKTPGYRFDPDQRRIEFGDGEAGRVPPPGAVVVASYRWTAGRVGNVGAGLTWSRLGDVRPPRPGRPPVRPAVRFRNPLPADGGRPPEELRAALARLVAEYAATERLVTLADRAKADTLDGVDLADVASPPMAVSLLDFECLARSVPGTRVARARAWAEADPDHPGLAVPGTVTVAVVPELPAARPTPTPGLLRAVAEHLDACRPVACRVRVTGPEYQAVRVRATVHTTPGQGPAVGARARRAVETFLHPLRGGAAGTGWPFGRDVHPGELLRALAGVDGVRYVTGLELAAGDGPWGEAGVGVPARALVAAAIDVSVREDA
jgi:hypothetical protein